MMLAGRSFGWRTVAGGGLFVIIAGAAGLWWASRPPMEDGFRLDGPIEAYPDAGGSEVVSAPTATSSTGRGSS
jgi:hypothetical protein